MNSTEKRAWIESMVTSEIWKRDIKKRAEEICLERRETGAAGDELSDWLAAEKDIIQEIMNYYDLMAVDPARRFDRSPHLLKYHGSKGQSQR
jgi:hypothetical protein